MSAGQFDEAEASARASKGPGQRLRQARLAQGLEIGRLANQLHLSEAVIEALEREDFARLPSPVFVKGYIANYGRLLGLPADPLLAAYARLQPELERSAEPAPRPRPMPKRLSGGNRLGYLLSGLILVGALAAGGWYWAKTRLQLEGGAWEFPGTTLDEPEEPSEELPPSLQAFLEEAPEPELAAVESQPVDRAEPIPASTQDTPVPAAEQPTPVPSVPPEAAPAAERRTPESAAADAEGPPQVVLELLGSCWVDIRDANGKNKIIGELTKGARRTLEGKPPFSLVLGNSRAVRILIDGVPYDIGQHARGNVARFKLDPGPAEPER